MTFFYCGVTDAATLCTTGAQVLLGPKTIVTADNNSTLTGLNSSAVSVGQHITARGTCVNNCIGPTVQLDATGNSSAEYRIGAPAKYRGVGHLGRFGGRER